MFLRHPPVCVDSVCLGSGVLLTFSGSVLAVVSSSASDSGRPGAPQLPPSLQEDLSVDLSAFAYLVFNL